MNPLIRRLRATAWLPVLLGLACWVALTPDKANAGCVHDGLSRGWRADGVAHFVRLADSRALTPPDGAVVLPEKPGRSTNRPCSGPTCSENPVAPTAPVGVVSAIEMAEWACLLDSSFARAEYSSCAIVSIPDAKRVGVRVGIFHPPRRVSNLTAGTARTCV
jgi:hypothetical protein